MGARACATAAFALGGLFLCLLACGPAIGNHKLWLGATYLLGILAATSGPALVLRERLAEASPPAWRLLALAAGLASLAALLHLPWVEPELSLGGLPGPEELGNALAAGLGWGLLAAAVLGVLLGAGMAPRLAWLAYLAFCLGPGPALAIACLPLWLPWLVAALLAGLTLALRALRPPRPAAPAAGAGESSLTFYWLLRALLLLWWGTGVVVALVAPWWQPHLDQLFTQSAWPRALTLGAFLMICVGVLAEYSLPLLGRQGLMGVGRERKLLGITLSALALIFALLPLFLSQVHYQEASPREFLERARADLLAAPIDLDAQNQRLDLATHHWLEGVSHLLVISHLREGSQVQRGEAVAQIVAEDELGLPHIFNLRAGVDTADRDLARRDLASQAGHAPARWPRWRWSSPHGARPTRPGLLHRPVPGPGGGAAARGGPAPVAAPEASRPTSSPSCGCWPISCQPRADRP